MEPRRSLVRDGEIARFFSQRSHTSESPANVVHVHGAQPNYDAIPHTDSLYFYDTGKRHFDPIYSKTEEPRPSKHKVPQKKSGEEKQSSKKVTVLKPSDTITPGHVKLFPEELVRRSTVNEKMFETKRVVLQGDGIPAKFRESDEFRMEQYMNRKQRIPSVERQRNGIPVAVAGDKGYKDVSLSHRYYEDGGLVPGSTIVLKAKTSIMMKKSAENSGVTKTKKLVPYAEKAAKASKEEELKDVLVLTNPYTKLNQKMPCWEDRTGFYIVRPEDEAD
jgi:hypothetical protein